MRYMKCIYCHSEIAADSRFCTNCGKDLSGLVRCKNCGELLGDEDEYCPHCGSKQPENNVDQSLNDGETAETPPRLTKFHVYIIIAFSILLLALIAFAYAKRNGQVSANDYSLQIDTISEDYELADTMAIDTIDYDYIDTTLFDVPDNEEVYYTEVGNCDNILRVHKIGEGGNFDRYSICVDSKHPEALRYMFYCYPNYIHRADRASRPQYDGPVYDPNATLMLCDNDSRFYEKDRSTHIPGHVEFNDTIYEVRTISLGRGDSYAPARYVLPNTVRWLPGDAFRTLRGLKEVVLNEGVEFIGEGAFFNCRDLEKVNIPSTVKTIQKVAFLNCKKIEKLHIPATVKDVKNGAAFLGMRPGVVIEVEEGCHAFDNLLSKQEVYYFDRNYSREFNPDDYHFVYVKKVNGEWVESRPIRPNQN